MVTKATALRPRSDMPFIEGDRAVERIGSGSSARSRIIEIVTVDIPNNTCTTSTGNIYDRNHGGRVPARHGQYRALHSRPYTDASYSRPD